MHTFLNAPTHAPTSGRAPRPKRRQRRRAAFTLVEMLIVVSIIGLLINIAMPSIKTARYKAQGRSCTANLQRIQFAKNTYIMEKNVSATAPESTFTDTILYGNGKYLNTKPSCPNAGVYSVGGGSADPTCSYGSGLLHTMTGGEVYSR